MLDGEATESSRRSRAVPLDAIPSILVCIAIADVRKGCGWPTFHSGVRSKVPLNRPCRRDGGRLSPGGERAFQIFEPAVAVREKCSLPPKLRRLTPHLFRGFLLLICAARAV